MGRRRGIYGQFTEEFSEVQLKKRQFWNRWLKEESRDIGLSNNLSQEEFDEKSWNVNDFCRVKYPPESNINYEGKITSITQHEIAKVSIIGSVEKWADYHIKELKRSFGIDSRRLQTEILTGIKAPSFCRKFSYYHLLI